MATDSDDFNRADENPLSDDGLWSSGQGSWIDLEVVSNEARVISAGNGAARRSGFGPGDDQFSEFDAVFDDPAFPTDFGIGPTVRAQGGSDESLYWADWALSSVEGNLFMWYVNDSFSFTQLGAHASDSVETGDTLRCEVTSTEIKALRNGSEIMSRSDANLSSGHPGIGIFSNNAVSRADDWSGGTVGEGVQIGLTGMGAKAINDVRDFVHPAEWVEAGSATNGVASATKSGVSGKAHIVTAILADYSGTSDVTGTLTITGIASGSIVVNVRNQREIILDHGQRSAEATDITVQLSAGGAGVVGRVTVMGHTVG